MEAATKEAKWGSNCSSLRDQESCWSGAGEWGEEKIVSKSCGCGWGWGKECEWEWGRWRGWGWGHLTEGGAKKLWAIIPGWGRGLGWGDRWHVEEIVSWKSWDCLPWPMMACRCCYGCSWWITKLRNWWFIQTSQHHFFDWTELISGWFNEKQILNLILSGALVER